MRVIVVLFVTLAACLSGSHAKKKSSFTAKTVQSIVEQEILKKIPAVKGRKLHKLSEEERTSLNGVHLKEATDAINKLVDESIVDRVQEAEKEVSQMLLKSIEHHIQDAGKVLLRQDENSCSDKIASCQQLSESGVCASSKDAMVINCPKTCNFCGILNSNNDNKKHLHVNHHLPKAHHHQPSYHQLHRHDNKHTDTAGRLHNNIDTDSSTATDTDDTTTDDLVEMVTPKSHSSNSAMETLSKQIGAGIFKSVGKGLLNTGISSKRNMPATKRNILENKNTAELSNSLRMFVNSLVKRKQMTKLSEDK